MQRSYTLPRRTLTLWRLRTAIVFGIPAALLFCLCTQSLWLLLPAGILTALLFVLQLWYLPAFFSRYSILVEDTAVMVYSGVIFRSCRIMPYPRLVCASDISTPLSRAMRLTAMQLSAVRGRILIPELCSADAEQLLSVFSEQGGDV